MKNRRKRSRSLLLLAVLLCALVVQGYAGQQPATVQEESLDTVWTRQYHDKTIYDIAFSPDGSLIASSSGDTTLKLVETATGELVRTIRSAPFQGSISFSPNGRYIASGGSSKAYIWEVATGELVRTIDEHKEMSTAPEIFVYFSPDGRFFITSGYDKLVVWDATSGEKVYEINDGDGWRVVSFAPDNKTMVLGWKSSLLIADIQTGTVREVFAQAPVSNPVYTPDGASIAVRYKYTDLEGITKTELLFLDTTDFSITQTIEFNTLPVQSFVFSPSGSLLLSVCNDNTLRLWDIQSGSLLEEVKDIKWASIAISPIDSTYIALGSAGRTIALIRQDWDITTSIAERTGEEAVVLYPPYPHPSEGILQFRYNLISTMPVELHIVNSQGVLLRTLVQQTEAAGEHIVILESTELPTGQYFCRLVAGHHTTVQPFIISR